MAFEQELSGFKGIICVCEEGDPETKEGRVETKLELQVLSSNAGYYLGYFCPNCGPYSRETGYMSREVADAQLEDYNSVEKVPESVRNTDFVGTESLEYTELNVDLSGDSLAGLNEARQNIIQADGNSQPLNIEDIHVFDEYYEVCQKIDLPLSKEDQLVVRAIARMKM